MIDLFLRFFDWYLMSPISVVEEVEVVVGVVSITMSARVTESVSHSFQKVDVLRGGWKTRVSILNCLVDIRGGEAYSRRLRGRGGWRVHIGRIGVQRSL
jgi:hypothetical protein